jgi:hypothetical protein
MTARNCLENIAKFEPTTTLGALLKTETSSESSATVQGTSSPSSNLTTSSLWQ